MKRQYDSEAARRRIADAATDLFSNHGFKATTTRMIAERSGVNAALIARYFRSKKALFDSLVHSGMDHVITETLNYPPQKTLRQDAALLATNIITAIYSNFKVHRMILLHAMQDARVAGFIESTRSAHLDMLRTRLARFKGADVEAVMTVFDSAICAGVMWALVHNQSSEQDRKACIRQAHDLIDICLKSRRKTPTESP